MDWASKLGQVPQRPHCPETVALGVEVARVINPRRGCAQGLQFLDEEQTSEATGEIKAARFPAA